MSLSTLLEAAKYLDYLDSNKNGSRQQNQVKQEQQQEQQQQQQQLHAHLQFQSQPIAQPTNARKSSRRQKSSRKDAANTMLAMSLPVSSGPIQMQHGVPIPLVGHHHIDRDHHHHQAASLSSSFTTGSPLSSFASTALLCSKASGITSASSSTASSLSSSDSSSSCGEIMMGDNDFNQSSPLVSGGGAGSSCSSGQFYNQILTHQQQQLKHNHQQPIMMHKFSNNNNNNNTFSSSGGGNGGSGSFNDSTQSFARYIAATSAGPQLVTMSTSSSGSITSASAPLDGRIRAGHVIQAATNNAACIGGKQLTSGVATGTSFDSRHHHFSLATTNMLPGGGVRDAATGQTAATTFGLAASSFGSDNHLSGSPGGGPLIMARVQPMILNSISPSSAHHHHQGLMAFQPNATASSPTSSSSSYSRHRELHKTLEKNRRAHLRHCFELLKTELPASDCVDKKTSHINIIKSAIRYVLALRQQECEIDNELLRLTKIKNDLTERLSSMRNGMPQQQQLQHHHQQQQQQIDNSNQQQQQQSTLATDAMSASTIIVNANNQQQQLKQEQSSQELQHQQPAAEQQLSFLLSQSKID